MLPDRQVIPLTSEGRALWDGEIAKSRQMRETVRKWWDANLKKYAPAPTDDPDAYAEDINTNRDFTLVERKKADLFFQKPDVTAIPSPLFAQQAGLLDTHTQILNAQLGLNGVHAKALAQRVLFDVLCPSGTGWSIMGYESATIDLEQQVPDGQPQPLPGAVLGLSGATTQPMKTDVTPVPVYEDCFWRWFSPYQALVPSAFRSTRWDDAPWLGMDFEIAVRIAKRRKWVPENYQGGPPDQKLYADYGGNRSADEAVAKGVVIYYKSALYRDDRVHPLHYTYLVLMDGVKDVAEHKDSPYQTLDQKGALTPDSLLGNPIHPCTVRTMTDAAYVPSNCTITRATINEINKTREQQLEYREAAILRWQYNVDVLPPDALGKIVRSPIGGFVGVPGEAFVGDGSIKELPHGTYPRENLEFNDRLDNDLARAWALDQNQLGVRSIGDQTATESQIQQGNANAVSSSERGEVLDWYCAGVTKYSTLIQRFWPVEYAAKIVGQPAAAQWDTWRKAVPASLAFTAMPDSTQRQDLAVDRKRVRDDYTYFANDPYVNRVDHLKHILPKLGLPSSLVVAQPPQPHPEPPKLSLALKSEDLDPLSPVYGNVYQVLTQFGVQNLAPPMVDPITAHAVQMASGTAAHPDTKHGGKLAPMESLDKHAVDLTGGMQGTGQPAPMGAGGTVQ